MTPDAIPTVIPSDDSRGDPFFSQVVETIISESTDWLNVAEQVREKLPRPVKNPSSLGEAEIVSVG